MEPIEDRFWRRIAKSEGCWNWTGPLRNGRGYLSHYPQRGKHVSAHRLSWMLNFGSIPTRLYVCHHCDNPLCVRPEHLFLGTAMDNKRDSMRKKRHAVGARINTAKLTDKDVLRIRTLYPARTQQSIADEYGVSQPMIGYIVRNESWRYLCPVA